jgi:hypothetical protein
MPLLQGTKSMNTVPASSRRSGLLGDPGRVAGLVYLLLVFLAPYRLMYVPSTLIVSGDAAATADNILAHELLFRLGIAADLACGVIVLWLTLALYRLFRGVDRNLAVLIVIVGGILPAAIDFLNTVNDSAALMLVRGADFLNVFEEAERQALAFLFLRLHDQVTIGAEVLWGLWLLPLAVLTWRSGFLPRFLAVWLVVNGITYVALSMIGVLLPQHYPKAFDLALPALLGEMAFMLWLVIRGARPPEWRSALPAT